MTVAGVEVNVKSPCAGVLEPPHDSSIKQKRKVAHPTSDFEETPIATPRIMTVRI
jgi:hypothetical protein